MTQPMTNPCAVTPPQQIHILSNHCISWQQLNEWKFLSRKIYMLILMTYQKEICKIRLIMYHATNYTAYMYHNPLSTALGICTGTLFIFVLEEHALNYHYILNDIKSALVIFALMVSSQCSWKNTSKLLCPYCTPGSVYGKIQVLSLDSNGYYCYNVYRALANITCIYDHEDQHINLEKDQ